MKYIKVLSIEEKRLKYRSNVLSLKITFRLLDYTDHISEGLSELLEILKNKTSDTSLVGIEIINDKSDFKQIFISYRRLDQLNVEVILDTIERVIQSNTEFFLFGDIKVLATIVEQ